MDQFDRKRNVSSAARREQTAFTSLLVIIFLAVKSNFLIQSLPSTIAAEIFRRILPMGGSHLGTIYIVGYQN